jgi:unsaturated chondroitin disaccharide hydrolase
MIELRNPPALADLAPRIARMWDLSAAKLDAIEASRDPTSGAPVFTVEGRYTSRGWTEWTQGFQVGSALLQYDATGDEHFLDLGRAATLSRMAPHLTHTGVHDHGFNNVSTYGALLRLAAQGRIPAGAWERSSYELALRCSAAVQAARWTELPGGEGFIHSFNGPHSLFSDTIRSLRVLGLGHLLGHVLMGENDRVIPLLARLVGHARCTARYNVYYGEGRDGYDVPGRVAHESVFNVRDGRYRCPSTQQGYSPFSTWTRGLAWILCGYAEQLEFLRVLPDGELDRYGGQAEVTGMMLRAARASADFYLAHTPTCGVPYWDTGAPGLAALGDYLDRPADPFNDHEPVDSSAAAIAAQGLLRLGHYLGTGGAGARYWRAGLTVVGTLLGEPYLSTDPGHQGLLLHTVYHWPNRWDHVPAGQRVACGESAMWGDYHLREVALYLQRILRDEPYLAFYQITGAGAGRGEVPVAAAGPGAR